MRGVSVDLDVEVPGRRSARAPRAPSEAGRCRSGARPSRVSVTVRPGATRAGGRHRRHRQRGWWIWPSSSRIVNAARAERTAPAARSKRDREACTGWSPEPGTGPPPARPGRRRSRARCRRRGAPTRCRPRPRATDVRRSPSPRRPTGTVGLRQPAGELPVASAAGVAARGQRQRTAPSAAAAAATTRTPAAARRARREPGPKARLAERAHHGRCLTRSLSGCPAGLLNTSLPNGASPGWAA